MVDLRLGVSGATALRNVEVASRREVAYAQTQRLNMAEMPAQETLLRPGIAMKIHAQVSHDFLLD